jgi:hypothetical protein
VLCVGKVEHQKIIGRGRSACPMPMGGRKFQVIGRARQTQHHAAETVVILKSE